MENNLTVYLRKVENGYMDFCLDFFDDKPVFFSLQDYCEDQLELFSSCSSTVFSFLEGILVLVLRYMFVKKYIRKESVRQICKTVEIHFLRGIAFKSGIKTWGDLAWSCFERSRQEEIIEGDFVVPIGFT